MGNNSNSIIINGPFWDAQATIVKVLNPVSTSPITLFGENFNTYNKGQSPENWRETGDLINATFADQKFKIDDLSDDLVLRTANQTQSKFHSHVDTISSRDWTNYQFRGQFRNTNVNGKVGVTFLSQFRVNGSNAYYRLSNEGEDQTLVLQKRVEGQEAVIVQSFNLAMPLKKFVDFEVTTEDTGNLTKITVKVNIGNQEEIIVFEDADNNRLISGTVGIYADGTGMKQFDGFVVKGLGAVDYSAIKGLFIDYPPAFVEEEENIILIPGTQIVVCKVHSAAISLFGEGSVLLEWESPASSSAEIPNYDAQQLKEEVAKGKLSLLALRNMSGGDMPTFRCLNGYINLNFLEAKDNAENRLYEELRLSKADPGLRSGMSNLPGTISLNASGISLFGAIELPWVLNPVREHPAYFLLVKTFAKNNSDLKYRLLLQKERFTKEEELLWIDAWQEFAAAVNPKFPQLPIKKVPAQPSSPSWLTFEVSDIFNIPSLFWLLELETTNSLTEPTLNFDKGTVSIFLTDQRLYDEENAPDAVAKILPDQLKVLKVSDATSSKLEIIINPSVDGNSLEDDNMLSVIYSAQHLNNTEWDETFKAQNLRLAYDAVETPRRLRMHQDLLTPAWNGSFNDENKASEPLDQPIIWGGVPLEDGWCQLPVFNLTEQIYIDIGLSNDIDSTSQQQVDSKFQGAVSYTNLEVLAQPEGELKENNWDFNILNTEQLFGKISLESNDLDKLELKSINLVLKDPEVSLNGFVWMSTQKPSVNNALPNFDNWINALFPINLKSISEKLIFPPLLFFEFEELNFKLPLGLDEEQGLHAVLDNWNVRYQADEPKVKQLMDANLLSENILLDNLPLIWIHHPVLPAIQALPLTQSSEPPNFPSTSRQLAPFSFKRVESNGAFFPDNWNFASVGGAKTWLNAVGDLVANKEWESLEDIPMVSLSIPGLIFDPKLGLSEPASYYQQLRVQYRLDLPYTDEINALAQLPKEPKRDDEITPLPDDPPIEPPLPLDRSSFLEHWQRLSNLANLASVDAVETLQEENGEVSVQNLIEPLIWPINLTAALNQYPGALHLQDLLSGESVSLEKLAALKGISGRFSKKEDNKIELTNTGDHLIEVEANSMLNWRSEDGKSFRDQRGLYRSQVEKQNIPNLLFQTQVSLNENGTTYNISSLFSGLEMKISEEQEWLFWFKDVPLKIKGNSEIFQASGDDAFIRSTISKDKDINDPEGLSKSYNFLQGYEWRLKGQGDTGTEIGYLPLLNLHFYPLSLDEVQFKEKLLEKVVVVGRLQLPNVSNTEQDTLNNTVRVTFSNLNGTMVLSQVAPYFDEVPIEWPLEVDESKSQGEIPRLCWSSLILHKTDSIPTHFELVAPIAKLLLFETEWKIQLENIDLSSGLLEEKSINLSEDLPQDIIADAYTLALDLENNFRHRFDLFFNIRLGDQKRANFSARIIFHIVSEEEEFISLDEAKLFDLLPLEFVPPGGAACEGRQEEEDIEEGQSKLTVHYANLSLQFNWANISTDQEETIYFLPGIPLNTQSQICNPGIATLSFKPGKIINGIPELIIQSGYLEAVFSTGWNGFLQSNAVMTKSMVFDATAGEVTIGFNSEFLTNRWLDKVLLNGYLEVKNLISWPFNLNHDPTTQTLLVPSASDPSPGDLVHLRHSIRILLNQHQLSSDILAVSELEENSDCIFHLSEEKTWQFLAVAEHQIVKIDPSSIINESEEQMKEEFRWTVQQEIRWIPKKRYKHFINFLSGKELSADDLSDVIESDEVFIDEESDEAIIRGRIINDLNQGIPNVRVQLYIKLGLNLVALSGVPFTTTQDDGSFEFIGVPKQEILRSDDGQVFFKVWRPGVEDFILPQDSPAWNLEMQSQIILLNIDFEARQANYLSMPLCELLSEALDYTDDHTIIVEASSPFWLRAEPIGTQNFTNIQFLPNGIQSAILSSPEDYLASDPQDPKWQLLCMPFIGRLQRNLDAYTNLEPENVDLLKGLNVDPIIGILGAKNLNMVPPRWALALSSWSDAENYVLSVNIFDSPTFLRFSSLDFQVLQENWIRLQNPPTEGKAQNLTSITASLPDGVSRISRAASLVQAFIAMRMAFPPKANDYNLEFLEEWYKEINNLEEGEDLGKEIVWEDLYGRTGPVSWREDSLMEFTFPSSLNASNEIPLQWVGLGLNLLELLSISTTTITTGDAKRFAAATVIPVPDHQAPMSFAVSPYLGLKFLSINENRSLLLVSSELLCLDQVSNSLRPIISRLWTKSPSGEEPLSFADLLSQIDFWARETHAKLCPDSPLAIVRLRKIEGRENAEGLVTTTYGFRWVKIIAKAQLPKRVFNLRTKVDYLKFREGQFGGFDIMSQVEANPQSLPAHDFELAAPQVVGVQAIYIDPEQLKNEGSLDEKEQSLARVSKDWPYGLSTLKLTSTFTEDSKGVVGKQELNPEEISRIRLWWQSVQHFVQYRSALSGQSVSGLPSKFKAEAIKSLLPILPDLPLPDKEIFDIINLDADDANDKLSRIWQTILPGEVSVYPIGSRSGAPFIFRHYLQTQAVYQDEEKQWQSKSLNSGSIPVQHRFPRPVSIPPNSLGGENHALQTWASYFIPDMNSYAELQPQDEAFFAGLIEVNEEGLLVKPWRGLNIRIDEPVYGAIPLNWNGRLELNIEAFRSLPGTEPFEEKFNPEQWEIFARIESENEKLIFQLFSDSDKENSDLSSIRDGKVILNFIQASSNSEEEELSNRLSSILNSFLPGETLELQLLVRDQETTPGFYQTLSIPLTMLAEVDRFLPVEPYFVQFEDPEYNRKLASSSANATRLLVVGKDLITMRLSTDRKTYNSGSKISFRFDILEEGKTLKEIFELNPNLERMEEKYTLVLKRFDVKDGVDKIIGTYTEILNPLGQSETLSRGKLFQFSILDELLNSTVTEFRPIDDGDTLQLELKIEMTKFEKPSVGEEEFVSIDLKEKIILDLNIVLENVDPVPDAAYALLKAVSMDTSLQVQCARFAWAPNPQRIELVNPDDLLTEIVRRRAVFKMLDIVRENREVKHAIQKITQNGSTHIIGWDEGEG